MKLFSLWWGFAVLVLLAVGAVCTQHSEQMINPVPNASPSSRSLLALNYVVFNQTRFATIDNVVPEDTAVGCQSGSLSVPSGWTVAANTPDAVGAIMSYQWGTLCLVVNDGFSYTTRGGVECGRGQLVSDSNGGFRPLECQRRVMISQPASDGLCHFSSCCLFVVVMISLGIGEQAN
jgi:hypothetical protein